MPLDALWRHASAHRLVQHDRGATHLFNGLFFIKQEIQMKNEGPSAGCLGACMWG